MWPRTRAPVRRRPQRVAEVAELVAELRVAFCGCQAKRRQSWSTTSSERKKEIEAASPAFSCLAGPQGGQRAEEAEAGQWRRPVLLQRLLEAAPKLLLLHALVGLLNGSRQALQEASAEQAGKSPLCFLLSLCL